MGEGSGKTKEGKKVSQGVKQVARECQTSTS